ncbi:hypothetical protein [Streptomyces sp. NBC_00401]|uniref:phosphotriesterase family protein n=1 Tax=Streptomyces sp. NBC_00401 TaxID=2975738 RepID=UPI00224DE92A|nr:hypothetical protein [Streptomyces sp. NBC_00401]MCX5087300.1 hypothetical protein [Streptomyces sp. NBC_00401]
MTVDFEREGAISVYIDWIDPAVMPLLPQWNYLHIADEVLPYLERRGVAKEQIDTMLVDVPRRYFEAGAKD